MTTAQFFEKFDLFAGAPDAVAKMRSFILELAVRGQLTSASRQPSDPSANPFPIPQDWRWVALREVAAPCGQKKPDARFTYIDVGAIDNQRGVISAKAEVVEAAKAPSRARKIVRSGCVIYATVRPYLRNIAIVTREFDPPAIASTAFAVLMPEKVLDAQFLFYWLRCASFQDIVSSKMKGVAYPAISDTEFWQCPIPLPPIAEQKRIVAKVDELMALCDQLEAQQQERETKHTALAQAALARFAEAPTPANLNLLFHSSFSIQPSDLRKTILTLAVQGKLVPQDSNDEPLPKTFAGLKIQDETIENAPSGWACLAYRDLTTLVTSGSRGWKQYYSSQGAIFVRTQNIKTDRLILDDVAYVDLPASTEGKRSQILPSDILITITGANVTKAARIETSLPEAYVSQHIALTRPKWESMSPWLHLCFVSPTAARGELERLAYGDKPGLNLDNIRNLRFPIPPLAEQKRIVAKVEELMALVDALEAQQAAADKAATHLLDAVVSELAAAA